MRIIALLFGTTAPQHTLSCCASAACAQGLVVALRAFVAAGAVRVLVPNNAEAWDLTFEPGASKEQRAAQLEALVQRMRAAGVRDYDVPLFSAHQMGSCRMGSSPRWARGGGCTSMGAVGMAQAAACAGCTCSLAAHAASMLTQATVVPLLLRAAWCRASVCDSRGECWEVAGLHVADGSLLPTPSGVNPMISIYALSYLVGNAIATRFKQHRKLRC